MRASPGRLAGPLRIRREFHGFSSRQEPSRTIPWTKWGRFALEVKLLLRFTSRIHNKGLHFFGVKIKMFVEIERSLG